MCREYFFLICGLNFHTLPVYLDELKFLMKYSSKYQSFPLGRLYFVSFIYLFFIFFKILFYPVRHQSEKGN